MANTKITSRVIADDAILTAAIADDQITSALIADDVALGGNPTTTTQSAGNNTTRIATTAFVSTAISNLVDSSPDALNTLNELAAALGDDANFSTTVTNSIATKLAASGANQTLTDSGNLTLDVAGVINLDSDAAEVAFKDGGTHIGSIINNGSDFVFRSIVQDKDVLIRGNDGGTAITALQLDMSDAGKAIFNSGGSFNGNVGFGTSDGDVRSDGVGNRTYVSIIGNANRGVLNIGSTASAGADGGKITFVNGTNAVGEIYVDPDSGSQTNGFMSFSTSNSERMRILSNGRVGISTTSPDSILHVDGSIEAPLVTIHQTGGINGNYRGLDVETSSTGTTVQRWFNAGTEIARVRGGGGIQIGQASAISSSSRLELVSGGSVYMYMRSTNADAGETFRLELDGNNTFYILNDHSQGVYIADTNTSWTGLSDETLKENITDIGSVLDKVKTYRTSKYNWVGDEKKKEHIGFIAQDWQKDFPQVIEKDGSDKLGINYAETNVVLLKAIQEQQTLIETQQATINDLKSRIETLEG